MRFQKNSFIFLETIFSLIILTVLVALFFKLNLDKESKALQLNTIYNQFKLNTYDTNFTNTKTLLTFIKNEEEDFPIEVKKTIYESSHVRLVKYEH